MRQCKIPQLLTPNCIPDYVKVRMNGKWGVVNIKGKICVPITSHDNEYLQEHLDTYLSELEQADKKYIK